MGDADTFSVECVEFAGPDVIWEDVKGNGGGVIVGSVLSGNGLEKVGRVLDSTGHRAYRILMLTNWDDKAAGGESYSRLNTDQVIDIARTEDASACLEHIRRSDAIEVSFAYFRAKSSESQAN